MKKSKLLLITTIVLLLINVLFYLTKPGGDMALQYFSDILPIVCALIASCGLFHAFRSFKEFDFAKITWGMLLLGTLFFMLGETTYAILEIGFGKDMNTFFPSIADLFWFIGYIPFFIGLMMMYLGYVKSGFPRGTLLFRSAICLLVLVTLAMVYLFVLQPIIIDEETELLSKVAYLYYPVADAVIIVPALILIYITSLMGSGLLSRPWKYLAFGFIFIAVGDLIYSYLGWMDLYGNGNLIDVSWHLGYLLIAMAGISQQELLESFKS